MNFIRPIGVLLLALMSTAAWAQTVSGTVTDENNQPLPGATVIVQGTTNGTSTDFDGRYQINATQGQTLAFSYVGYATQQVTVSAATHDVMLQTDNTLDEVVVTGTGTATSKRKTAIAVETVNSRDLKRAPAGDISQALIGKIPGARIQSTSGQPGQQQSILLRGINTLSTTQPMILVDGVQINTDNINNGSTGNVSSRLADLDLSDVERVEVIQGAAAGTIYGAQGANGVIQIFTRKGEAGKIKINLKTNVGYSSALRGNFGLTNLHYFETTSEGFLASNAMGDKLVPDANSGVWETPIGNVDKNTLVNKPFKETTYDNLDLLLKDNAVTSNSSVSISGGSDKVQFFSSLSHLNQESIINGALERNNLKLNVTGDLSDKFSARVSSTFISSKNTSGGISNTDNVNSAFSNAILIPQYVNLKNTNSSEKYVAAPTGDNSINPFYTFQNRTYNSDLIRVIGNINLKYDVSKFLKLDYKYGFDVYENKFKDFIKNQSSVVGTTLDPTTGRLIERPDKGTTQNSLMSAFINLNFEDDFGISNFPLTTTTHLAYDWRREDFSRITVTGTDLPSFSDGFNLQQAGTTNATAYNESIRTYGFLINQKIDYKNYAGISGGLRVDWSSAFGEGSEPFTFPRGDVYVRLDSFINKNWLNQFKLRAAYGEAGIQPGPFDRVPILTADQIDQIAVLNLPNELQNPALGVQISKEFEFGTDLSLNPSNSNWLSRVDLNATFYSRESEDVIRSLDIAPSGGSAAILTNALSIKTEGLQLGININVVTLENFKWNSTINFGTFESIIDDIANDADIALGNNHVLKEGASVGAFFGRAVLTDLKQTRTDGTRYIKDADVNDYEVGPRGYVVNKDSKRAFIGDEQILLGDPTPDFTMSFINNFYIYKNLDLSFQLDWVKGNDIYNQTKQWLYRDLIHQDVSVPVTINNVTGAYAAFYTNLYSTNNPNSAFVEDGSFVRLRNLSISYEFGGFFKNLSSLRLTFSGDNLITWTNYSGIDPEASSNFNDPTERGLDQYAFPNFKTYSLGVNLSF